MRTNQLTPEGREVLLAVFKGGAKTGERYITTITSLVQMVGWPKGDVSNELLMKTLHELTTGGYSIQNGEMFTMGSFLSEFELYKNEGLALTVKVPLELVRML